MNFQFLQTAHVDIGWCNDCYQSLCDDVQWHGWILFDIHLSIVRRPYPRINITYHQVIKGKLLPGCSLVFSIKSKNSYPKLKCFLCKFLFDYFPQIKKTCFFSLSLSTKSKPFQSFSSAWKHAFSTEIMFVSKLFHIKSFLSSKTNTRKDKTWTVSKLEHFFVLIFYAFHFMRPQRVCE